MSKREALRELQTRLAQRLQGAQGGQAQQAAWLAAESAGQGFLFPLADAGEIFPVGVLRTVPRTQPWFVGVANLRGALHGVVDLAAFLGLPPVTVAMASLREQRPMVALNPSLGVQCALLVDRLAGLRRADQLSAQFDDSPYKPDFARGRWADTQGRVWQELDLRALARHEQFLTISNLAPAG